MAHAIYQTITTTGTTTPIVVDYLETPFAVAAAVEVKSGTTIAAVQVQYTLDDPNLSSTWTPIWFNAGTAVATSTVFTFGPGQTYPGPIRALMLNVGTLTGTGATIQFAVLQGISPR